MELGVFFFMILYERQSN